MANNKSNVSAGKPKIGRGLAVLEELEAEA